ncbi:MAG TPA: phospholipase D-like domain-containing protein [Thermomicrobiales bacterium]|nr:phospholipase D-like domain-containing protein [Thermomicrobiales bacterium]
MVLLCALILTGCSLPWQDDGGYGRVASCLAEIPSPSSTVTGVFVQPDDGYPPVLDELDSAQCTIDVTIYMLTDNTIFTALLDAEERGVQVRVILDQHPYGMFGDQQEARDRLEAGGVDVTWSNGAFQFTHAKYIVIDQQVALIMNQNLTGAAFTSNREFGIVTTDPGVVDQAQMLFDTDWVHGTGFDATDPLVISPETSRDRITRLIESASTSIEFYAEVIRDDGILATFREAMQRGVRIRLIVNQSVDPADLEAIAALSEIGVEVRLMPSLYIHSKVMAIDGETALIGSQNYTMTSLDRNREVGLIIDDPLLLERITAVFERDWSRAIPAGTIDLFPTFLIRVRSVPESAAGGIHWCQSSPLLTVRGYNSCALLTDPEVYVYSVRTVPRGWVQSETNRRLSRWTLLRGLSTTLEELVARTRTEAVAGRATETSLDVDSPGTHPIGTFV